MTGTLLFLGLGMQEILFIALIVLLFFGGKKIPELMKAQPTFIAVGVRHLPGKDGLIALLLEKGYQVEPIGL